MSEPLTDEELIFLETDAPISKPIIAQAVALRRRAASEIRELRGALGNSHDVRSKQIAKLRTAEVDNDRLRRVAQHTILFINEIVSVQKVPGRMMSALYNKCRAALEKPKEANAAPKEPEHAPV